MLVNDPSRDAWLSRLPESIPDALIVVHRNGAILYANENAEKLFGYPRVALLGRSVEDLVPRAVQHTHAAMRAAYFAAPQTRPMGTASGLMALRADGTEVPVDISLSPIHAGGEVFAIASIRDVEDRLAILRKLADREALEGFNRELRREVHERQQAEAALRDSEQQLRQIIAQAPVAIAMFDREMRYVAASRRWCSDYKLGDRDLTGESHYDVFPDLPERWHAVHRRALAGEVVSCEKDRFDRADDTSHWLHWEARPWYDQQEIGGIILFTEDITDRQRATDEIVRLNRELERRVQERTAQLAVSERTLQTKVHELEEANREIVLLQELGEVLRVAKDPAEGVRALTQFLPRFFPGATGAVYLLDARRATAGGHAAEDAFPFQDCWAIRLGRPHGVAGGERDALCIHCSAGSRRGWCLPIAGIDETLGVLHLAVPSPSEQQRHIASAIAKTAGIALSTLRLREALLHQALRDPLTGVFNRRYMEESLGREVHRAERIKRPLAVLLFDLDHFKRVNDSHGHAVGDQCLVQFAAYLGQRLRKEDVLCRYGGEEFLVVLPECTAQEARNRAEGIRQGLKNLCITAGTRMLEPLTVSGGIAEYPKDGETVAALLHAADRALYRAKSAGRNRVLLASSENEAGASAS